MMMIVCLTPQPLLSWLYDNRSFMLATRLTNPQIDQFTLDATKTKMDKSLIRRRLARITTAKPDANPSRSTLQSVHAFLMPRET